MSNTQSDFGLPGHCLWLVMRNSGRGRADERDRIAASLSGWYNQLHLLFNHLFLVFIDT